MFSGYLDATPQGETVYKLHMHYTFWESEGDPAKDPLLIWSNGGPGAGSEFGAFTELGPLLLYDASMKNERHSYALPEPASVDKSGEPSDLRRAAPCRLLLLQQ
jgi:carboxypeptidase C (cathepsin A)